MLFNSLEYFLFFPVTVAIYFVVPHRHRWLILLIASCLFYAFFSLKCFLLLIALTMISYICALLIEKYESRARAVLIAGILFNVAALFIFKYLNFFGENLVRIARIMHWNYSIDALKLLLPIGLSFYSLQIISYLVEVYTGNQKAERRPGIYALYVIFFPKLLAGPIEKPYSMIPQFYERHDFNYRQVVDGLMLVAWGIFQKIVIADRLAVIVNPIFAAPRSCQGFSFVIATIFFAFQIYCDFSGYSDIARGSAQVMGFKLINNFNRPYFSKSIYEFWRRWHISLSMWLRDYIYTPIVFYCRAQRVAGVLTAIMITFVICGLWHGAQWTFIIWGTLNGVYIICEIVISRLSHSFNKAKALSRSPLFSRNMRVAFTFSLTCFAWIFFKANNLKDAGYIIINIFTGSFAFFQHVASNFHNVGTGKGVLEPLLLYQKPGDFFAAVIFIGILLSVHLIQRGGSIRRMILKRPLFVRWSIYYLFIMSIVLFGFFGAQVPFTYFQF